MSERTKKQLGIMALVSSMIILSVAAAALLFLAGGAGQASSDDTSKGSWVCSIDSKLTETECEEIKASDPGYISEEDAKANFGIPEEGKGPGVLSDNSCSLNNNIVTCEGSDGNDTFYIGRVTGFWGIKFLVICIQGVNLWAFSPSVSYVNVLAKGGLDRVEVLDHSEWCIYNGQPQTIVYPYESSWSAYLVADGGAHNDTIYGTHNADTILGGSGNDTIDGRAGNDYLYGGYNNDWLYCGTSGKDHVYGGSENDGILCDQKPYCTDIYCDYLYGETGYDVTYGSVAYTYMNDLSHGATDGNEFYPGIDGYTVVKGDYGTDYIESYGATMEAYGYEGNDYIYGDLGPDYISGGPGNDHISGGGASDDIFGGENDDCIVGDYTTSTNPGHQGSDDIDAGTGNDCVWCDDAYNINWTTCLATTWHGVENDDEATGCAGEERCYLSCGDNARASCENPS